MTRPVSFNQRLFWVGLGAGVLGLLEAAVAARPAARLALRLAAVGGLYWWLFGFLRRSAWEALPTALAGVGSYALGTAILGWCYDRVARRSPGPGLSLAWSLSVGAIALALTLGRSASFGQSAGALAAALGAGVAVGLWNRSLHLSGAGGALALILSVLVLGGFHLAELTAVAAGLCLAGPLAPAAVDALALAKTRPRTALVLRILLAVLLPSVAAWLTYEPKPDNPYGY